MSTPPSPSPLLPNGAAATPASRSTDAVLVVRSLNYTYPGGVAALSDISFSLHAGQRLGILGPNGAGKSTLLLHLAGILPPSAPTHPADTSATAAADAEPTVTIGRFALTPKNLPRIREQVGLVFQNPDDQLFCPTIYDDIAFGPRNMGLSATEVAQRVEESLRQVGLLPPLPPAPAPTPTPSPTSPPAAAGAPRAPAVSASRNPALAPFMSRSPLKLSLGQKKRVALATVLSMRPALIALDEPTSNLDPRGRSEIIALLASLPCTQLIVTHDLPLVQEICHEALVLSQGRIVARGEARAVLENRAGLTAAGLI